MPLEEVFELICSPYDLLARKKVALDKLKIVASCISAIQLFAAILNSFLEASTMPLYNKVEI
jgi:hypothetical protein